MKLPSYVISLHSDPEAIDRLSSQGFDPTLFHAKRHPKGGRIGCFESHFSIYKAALKRGDPYVAIFEDDVEFLGDINWHVLHETLETHEPDVYLFGARGPSSVPSNIQGAAHFFGVIQGAHAYVASRAFMEHVVRDLEDVDWDWDLFFQPIRPSFVDVYRRYSKKTMGQYPLVARQGCDHESTISVGNNVRKNNPSACDLDQNAWYHFGQYALSVPVLVSVLVLVLVLVTFLVLLCRPRGAHTRAQTMKTDPSFG